MKKEGLLVEPEFTNIEKYLTSGERTEISKEIKEIAQTINGQTDEMVVRNILLWINRNTTRLRNGDPRKFKRTASEILESKERTGCCDSSTLFTAIARAKGIPTMQVIALNKEWATKMMKGENVKTASGHYFVACYLKDIAGKSDWMIIDSDVKDEKHAKTVQLKKLDRENRNIDRYFYAFAYARDYMDIKVGELKIDSSHNMKKIQIEAYKRCDIKDFIYREEREEFER